MKIYRDTKNKYRNGTYIELDANELAHAIRSYLYALDVLIDGASTVSIATRGGDEDLCGRARVYVDLDGRVIRGGDEIE
jgi:hypothetical protein